ncbi:ABC transporter substrate-binding protein [Pseudorhodobacter aquimaris]|uniref:ABC transporter substrate-binding protein n=1 Tax=Pseudorhodobacter aquimaris TaxID=687412 RepID=UPI00067C1BAE|nr:ABC transporter substrate-binding protein [Pseudorhodobacter aquimaris]
MTCFHLTRRSILAGAAASLALPAIARANIGRIEALGLWGPPAGPSITLSHAVAQDMFKGIATEATMNAWRTPDELRAGLTSGQMLLSVVPIQAAARLYNKGFPIRLANVMTNGLLYILTGNDSINSISDLKGKHVAVPFRGDVPEIIFGQLLTHHGIEAEADIKLTYAGTPIEAMQLLLAGRVDAALTAEPASTAGITMAKQAGKALRRAINLQEAFGEMTAGSAALPQAGLAVMQGFLDSHGDALPAILDVIAAATAEVLADPAAANLSIATKQLGMPAPLLAGSIPHSNLVARPAVEARGDVEQMLTAMGAPDFANLGGGLPNDGFYL